MQAGLLKRTAAWVVTLLFLFFLVVEPKGLLGMVFTVSLAAVAGVVCVMLLLRIYMRTSTARPRASKALFITAAVLVSCFAAYMLLNYLMSVSVNVVYDGDHHICTIMLDGDAIVVSKTAVDSNLISEPSVAVSDNMRSGSYVRDQGLSIRCAGMGTIEVSVLDSNITYVKFRRIEINGKVLKLPLDGQLLDLIGLPASVITVVDGKIRADHSLEFRWTKPSD